MALLKFKKDEKYGLIDLNGKILLDAIYDDIYSLKGTKDVVITVQDKKLGLVNSEGTIVIPNKYTQIKSLGEDTNLYIVQDENGKYGIYNKTFSVFQFFLAFASFGVYNFGVREISKIRNDRK